MNSAAPGAKSMAMIVTIAIAVGAGGVITANRPAADQITDQISGTRQQRDSVNGRMDALRRELGATQDREGALRGAIGRLDAEIAAQNATINAAQDALATIDSAIGVARDRLATTVARLALDKHRLGTQMVVIYKIDSGDSAVTDLLGSGDVQQLYQRYVDIRRIAAAEQVTAQRVHEEQVSIQGDLTQIAIRQQQQRVLLLRLHDGLARLNDQLGTRQQEDAMLAALVAQDEQRLVDAEAAGQRLDAEIASLQAQEAAAQAAARHRGGGNGRFAWPLTGPITQGFGCTSYAFEPFDPSCAGQHFHTGLDIAPGCGTAIGAADAGIAYLYSSGVGYGNHVIIIHGNGWASVYGHMESFAVQNGQAVSRGTIIGSEGSSGNSTGCHLHFEIRRNDLPADPLQSLG